MLFFIRKLSLVILFVALFCSGCGVKAPPVAPEREEKENLKLDCSIYDPECDKEDPNYIPMKIPQK